MLSRAAATCRAGRSLPAARILTSAARRVVARPATRSFFSSSSAAGGVGSGSRDPRRSRWVIGFGLGAGTAAVGAAAFVAGAGSWRGAGERVGDAAAAGQEAVCSLVAGGTRVEAAAAAAAGTAPAVGGHVHHTPRQSNVSFSFQDSQRVALVTGGGSGIGRACALTLARAGCDVFVVDLQGDYAEQTAAAVRRLGRRAVAFVGDVCSPESMEGAAAACVAQLGALDFCISNAGIVRAGSVLTMPTDDWKRVFDVNVNGAFNVVKACARQMVASNRPGGRIVIVSSANAVKAASQGAAYCASKAALVMATRCFAQDLAPFEITCNTVGPGATDTPLMVAQVDSPDALEALESSVATGRMASPREIAQYVAFLCTTEAAYQTGTYTLVDGGLLDFAAEDRAAMESIIQMRQERSGAEVLAAMDAAAEAGYREAESQRQKHRLL